MDEASFGAVTCNVLSGVLCAFAPHMAQQTGMQAAMRSEEDRAPESIAKQLNLATH